jgi:hypothetical protein
MSDYTGQFGDSTALLGQFQFGGIGGGVGVPGESAAVEGRQRWIARAYAVCWEAAHEAVAWVASARVVRWVAHYKAVRWLLRARRMTNV